MKTDRVCIPCLSPCLIMVCCGAMELGQQLLQYMFSGLSTGAIYALIGIGFSIIYNATGIINFAQGEFVMLGGMLTVFMITTLELPLWAAIPLAIVLATGV